MDGIIAAGAVAGASLASLVVAVIALRLVGTRRWAGLMRLREAQLEAGRSTIHDDARRRATPSTRFHVGELEGLPAPVQRYFRAVLQDGQPIIGAVCIEMAGTINMSQTAQRWKTFTSRQRVITTASGARPGFVWNAEVALFPGLPACVEDSYIAGQGRLLVKLFGLFAVARAGGDAELSRGEFMRCFAEAPWYPTALLPSQGVRWQAVDDAHAMATLVDGALGLSLLFGFDGMGYINTVQADSRGAGVGKDRVMLPWSCSFSDYRQQDGMMIPMAGEAAWMRHDGRRPYFIGQVSKLHYELLR